MKTLYDCKNKVVRHLGITWSDYTLCFNRLAILRMTNNAAELYGRYCSFVGYLNGKKERKH